MNPTTVLFVAAGVLMAAGVGCMVLALRSRQDAEQAGYPRPGDARGLPGGLGPLFYVGVMLDLAGVGTLLLALALSGALA